MAEQPAVVIIARHGPRLDVADRHWHLTTPTPYDPPLTYGGYNHSRLLGTRIASLLYAREQTLSNSATSTGSSTPEGVKSHDFAGQQASNGSSEPTSRKRKRRTHRVTIHSSPYLRCVQTSVAIAAGIAQFVPPTPSVSGTALRPSASSRARTPNYLSSMSPRTSVSDHGTVTGLLSVPEARHGLTHELSSRVAQDIRARHKRSKLRVDAFLGEWLNPEYFEDITPPPPSAMMVATAKAELMQNDTIDIFMPSITHKSSRSSLWGGASNGTRPQSRDSALEDWDEVTDALPAPTPRRDRTSSHSSIASSDSAGSRMQHRYGPQSFLRSETTAYAPPTPTYAISTSDRIPKGYFAHAKNHCTNIDYHWDSSRLPQDWGDSGDYGEEWSLMQRRFRRGLTQMVHWYSQHNADDRGEDALGLDQAEHHLEDDKDDVDEQEDLVIILVTHSAGCNALIGALTGQPVLLDAGTASLTMAVRKDDAPPTSSLTNGMFDQGDRHRRGSFDVGLAAIYDLKIIASTEHLRPGYDPLKHLTPSLPRPNDPLARLRPVRGDSVPGVVFSSPWNSDEQNGRSSTSTALGSIRRPQTPGHSNTASTPTQESEGSLSLPESGVTTPSSFTGLWTPPSARTPQLQAKYIRDERREMVSSLNEGVAKSLAIRPATEQLDQQTSTAAVTPDKSVVTPVQADLGEADVVTQLHSRLSDRISQPLSRALWRALPGDQPVRDFTESPKRRWTVIQEQ